MVYVPWRLSSLDACHISEEEWTGLRIIVIEALNQSSIGLEGPSVHGQAWDDWYEALAENVAKKYWPDTDRSAVRRIFRPQVIEMAGVERGKRRAQRAGGSEDSDGGGGNGNGNGNGPATHNTKNEEEDDDSMSVVQKSATPDAPTSIVQESATPDAAGTTPSSRSVATDTPRRGPGRPRKKTPVNSPPATSAAGKRPATGDHPASVVAPTPAKRSRRMSAASRAQQQQQQQQQQTAPTFVVPSRPPFGLILETRVGPDSKTKIIYASDTPTLPLFLEKVRQKFSLPADQSVNSVEVEVDGGKTYVVDLEDERDWLAVQEIAKNSGSTMIGVIVGV